MKSWRHILPLGEAALLSLRLALCSSNRSTGLLCVGLEDYCVRKLPEFARGLVLVRKRLDARTAGATVDTY